MSLDEHPLVVEALAIEHGDEGLIVRFHDREQLLSWRWLRDQGEDPASFDHHTRQRRVDALGGAPAPAESVELTEQVHGPVLSLHWPEAPHSTWVSTATIASVLETHALRPVGPRHPWRNGDEVNLTVPEVEHLLADDAGLTDWVQDLWTYGLAKAVGYDGTTEQLDAVASRVGYARASVFGTLWDLSSELTDHSDTAYSQTFLAPHTDGTYCHDAPGLQMFGCVERTGDGGESITVDGLAIVEDLRTQEPDAYELLTRIEVPAHYIEPGVELRAARPAIRLFADGTFRQLSLNNYDRSPMLLPPAEMARFYDAYGLLQRLADDAERWMNTRLDAGDVLIVDNWRCLHGRQSYTGRRFFRGCYLNHEDFESRCRVLGIGG